MRKLSFSKEELQQIEEAVDHLENKFPVELVPVFESNCDTYPVARYRASIIGLVSGFFLLTGLLLFDNYLLLQFPLWAFGLFWMTWVLLVIAFTELFPAFKRLLISKEELFYTTYKEAQVQFLEQGMSDNPLRAGILIHISFFERKFHLLTDGKGDFILSSENWEELADSFSSELKRKTKHESIINCIKQCEVFLEKGDFHGLEKNKTQISNHLREE